jgi:hypothetical protein
VTVVATRIDGAADLTVRTVSGVATAWDLHDAIAAGSADAPTRFVLWDFTEAQLDGLAANEVRALADSAAPRAAGRPGGRTALVFDSESAFGLGRIFDQLRTVRDAPVEYRSFRDRAAAMAWLGERP